MTTLEARLAVLRALRIDTGDLINDPLYRALDALYMRGWTDHHQARKCDPRGCIEWQVVLDLFRIHGDPRGMALVPLEPTYQMAEAMGVKWESGEGFPRRYAAMLAAAQEPTNGRLSF